MRVALLADIHANLPALEAVLAETKRVGVDRIAVLGDLVGYNAHPRECVQLVGETTTTVVAGNHDRGVTDGVTEVGTNATAQNVLQWTRAQLDNAAMDYLRSLPPVLSEPDGLLLAHGCFLNDVFYRGYVTSTMLETNLQTIADHESWPKVACCGHTHVGMAGWLANGTTVEVALRSKHTWPKQASAVLINPGSVGQPRDGDQRASFAVVDVEERTIEGFRVPYDVASTTAAISKAGLSESLAARLWEGR